MTPKAERKFYLREYMAISRAISTYEDINLLLQHLVEGVCRTFKIKACSILLYDDNEKELFRISSCGLSDEYISKGSVHMYDGFDAFKKGESLLYVSHAANANLQYADEAIKEGIVSMLSMPIKSGNAIIGILKCYHSEQILMHEDDIESIKSLLLQVGVVIKSNGMKNFIDNLKAAVDNLPFYITEGF